MYANVRRRNLEDTPVSNQPDLFGPPDPEPDAPASGADPECVRFEGAAPSAADPNLHPPANDVGAPSDALQQVAPDTMADVLRRLDDLPVEHRKRAELKSAVRTFCKAVGVAPANITTEVKSISLMIAGVSPALAGLNLTRWARVRSLLLTALRRCGIDVMPGRSTEALSPEWLATVALLETAGARYGVSRFASHMSRKGIAPRDATADDFAGYRETLLTGSLHPKPERAYRGMVRIWNKAAATLPGWPNLIIELEPDRRLYSLPLADFPTSFRTDVDTFLYSSGDPDPLSEHYAKPVSPDTVKLRRGQIRQLASALVGSGFPIEGLTSLAVLVQEPNARAALRHLLDRNFQAKTKHLAGQARLIQTIARHWVKTCVDDVRLGQMASALKVPSSGMVERNRVRLLQFDLPDNVNALLRLPAQVLREVERKPTGSREEALRVMFAVAVEILIMAPMRLRNLTRLELGAHLIETRRGGARVLHIVIPSADTKTKAPYEMPLPKESQVLIDRYVALYRPRIFARQSARLFPGRSGGVRAFGTFSTNIARFILKETGIVMHTHLFRHLAGKLYLDANPNDIETVRRFLSHKSTNTTLRSYVSLTATHAIERYDRLVASLRSAMKPIPPAPRSRRRVK